MTDRRIVVEVIATAALEVDIPIDAGDELEKGVETALDGIAGIRHVAIEELGDVSSRNGQLRVEVYARLTFHFDPDAVDDPDSVARERLDTSDVIASVQAFTTESGPYRIEAW